MDAMTSSVTKADRWSKVIGLVALCAAMALAAAFSIRTLALIEDLGYHLAYGDKFLATGKIVDESPELYTLNTSEKFPHGPGGWYDSDGKYRFVMSSWGSEVVMSLANKLGGVNGLCLLNALLSITCFVLMALILRRMAVPLTLSAAIVALAALVGYERLNLRPELFGYIILLIQLYLLCGTITPDGEDKILSGKTMATIVVLQMVLANMHGNFPLGIAITLSFLVGAAISRFLSRWRNCDGQIRQILAKNLRRLALLLILQFAICFINPWTWRTAILLPYEQIVMIKEMTASANVSSNPQEHTPQIYEAMKSLELKHFDHLKATYFFIASLAVAGIGMLCALARRRWQLATLILGMTVMALSVRKQMMIGTFFMLTAAGTTISMLITPWLAKFKTTTRSATCVTFAVAVILGTTFFICQTVTGRFYITEGSPVRFGLGISRTMVPLDAAEWMTKHSPAGKLWSEFSISSSIYYLTNPHPDVPINTNGFAYPPAIMSTVHYSFNNKDLFDKALEKYNFNIVAMLSRVPVAPSISGDKRWQLVSISGLNLLFLRTDGPDAELAKQFAITEESLDLDEYAARLRADDTMSSYPLQCGAETLSNLEWFDKSAQLSAMIPPEHHDSRSWQIYGIALANRGTRRELSGDYKGRDDWAEAKKCFDKSLELQPDCPETKICLEVLANQLKNRQLGLAEKNWIPGNFHYYPKHKKKPTTTSRPS